MRRVGIVVLVLVVLVVGFLYFPRGGAVANAADNATLAVVHGDVDTMHAGGQFAAALDGDVVASGDVVRANAQGLAVVTFFDGSTLAIEPGSQVTVTNVSRLAGDGINVQIEQTLGRTWAAVQKLAPGSQFQIKTPTSTAAVRGTAFEIVVAVVAGVLTTTVKGQEGDVLVTAAAGGSVDVTPGTQVDIPQNGSAPNAPSPQPPAPTLRFAAAATGVGYAITDPRGLSCGGPVRQIPGCTTDGGAVTIVDPPAGAYGITLTAAAAANGPLVRSGSGTLSGTLAVGDVARSGFNVAVSGGQATVGAFEPLVKLATTCGAESAGRIFAGGSAGQPVEAARGFAQANHGQPVAVVITAAQLRDVVTQSAAAPDSPAKAGKVDVTIDAAGIQLAADATVGPLPVSVSARVVGGARDGGLLLHIAELNAGILPPAVKSQLVSALQSQLDAYGGTFPLTVQRVSFKPGCMAIIGTTR